MIGTIFGGVLGEIFGVFFGTNCLSIILNVFLMICTFQTCFDLESIASFRIEVFSFIFTFITKVLLLDTEFQKLV